MKTKKPQHACKFMKRCQTLDALYPPHLKFAKIRRKLRECLLVSEENGRRCYTPQGNTGYIFQKDRQLTRYLHVIHPYSKFCQYWEMAVIIEYLISFITRSFLVTQYPDLLMNYSYQIPAFFSDLFQTTDVWLRFNIGFMDKKAQEIVLERREIFFHVIKKFSFYADAFTSLPLEMIVFVYTKMNGAPTDIIRYCVLYKVIKIKSLLHYLMHMAKIFNWSNLCVRIIWMVFLNFILCHTVTCTISVLISDNFQDMGLDNHHCFFRYIRTFYVVTCLFFGQSGIRIGLKPDNEIEKIFYLFTILILNITGLFFVAVFIQLLALLRSSKLVFSEMKQEVQRFLAEENLPKHTHKKVMRYLDHRYCHGYFNEEIIHKTLSPPLRREVMKFLCCSLFRAPGSIFMSLPEDLAIDLCFLMKFETFLPGDIIFRLGTISNKIYFLYSGSVAVYSVFGKEVMHWYEGQQFGMSSFLDKPINQVSAVALEITECYYLRYKDYQNGIADHYEIEQKIIEAARERVDFMLKIFEK